MREEQEESMRDGGCDYHIYGLQCSTNPTIKKERERCKEGEAEEVGYRERRERTRGRVVSGRMESQRAITTIRVINECLGCPDYLVHRVTDYSLTKVGSHQEE